MNLREEKDEDEAMVEFEDREEVEASAVLINLPLRAIIAINLETFSMNVQ